MTLKSRVHLLNVSIFIAVMVKRLWDVKNWCMQSWIPSARGYGAPPSISVSFSFGIDRDRCFGISLFFSLPFIIIFHFLVGWSFRAFLLPRDIIRETGLPSILWEKLLEVSPIESLLRSNTKLQEGVVLVYRIYIFIRTPTIPELSPWTSFRAVSITLSVDILSTFSFWIICSLSFLPQNQNLITSVFLSPEIMMEVLRPSVQRMMGVMQD